MTKGPILLLQLCDSNPARVQDAVQMRVGERLKDSMGFSNRPGATRSVLFWFQKPVQQCYRNDTWGTKTVVLLASDRFPGDPMCKNWELVKKRESVTFKVVSGGKQSKMIGPRRKRSLGTYEIWRTISAYSKCIPYPCLTAINAVGKLTLARIGNSILSCVLDISLLTLIAPSFRSTPLNGHCVQDQTPVIAPLHTVVLTVPGWVVRTLKCRRAGEWWVLAVTTVKYLQVDVVNS
jgi:hypothetical protein